MSFDSESTKQQLSKYVAELVESGKLTAENYTKNAVTSKLLTSFMDGKNLPRPKVRPIWEETIKAAFGASQPKPADASKAEKAEKESNDKSSDDEHDEHDEHESSLNEFEQMVESEPRKPRGKKSTDLTVAKAADKSHRYYSTCQKLNIDNSHSKYNVSGNAPKTFPQQTGNLEAAELELIDYFVHDKSLVAKYNTMRKKFINAVAELREKYELDPKKKPKKVQKFTITTKTVKYVNPADNKLAELPPEEQQIFRNYEKEMKEFERLFNNAVKGKTETSKSDKPSDKLKAKTPEEKLASKMQELQFLLLGVIRTQNIVNLAAILKGAKEIDEENTNKLTNTCIEPIEKPEQWDIIEKENGYKPFAPDYMQLFIDIKKFTGSNYGRLCKNIFEHRDALINHSKLTPSLKRAAWLQALGNIKKLISTNEKNLIFDCWENVLSSEFAFRIVMNGLPPSSFFKKSFETLIQEPLSIQLFESALYPISFCFTPNMLGYADFDASDKCFGCSDATYKKNLQLTLETFGAIDSDRYNYSACNWIYYFNKSDVRNEMISLLNHAVELANKENDDNHSEEEQ